MRTKRADSFEKDFGMSYTMVYTVYGKEYTVSGEFEYNRAKGRYEHVHVGPRGGETLIYAKQ